MHTNDRANLRALGWNEHFERQLENTQNIQTPGLRLARVASALRGRFLVSDGEEEWLATPAGRLMAGSEEEYPVTGDWVLVYDTMVMEVLPRKNLLARGDAGSRSSQDGRVRRGQPIASNLDSVFLVCGLDRDFNLRRIERGLTLVYNCGLEPVVVLTKADLHEAPEAARQQALEVAFGVPVVLSSSADGRGRKELAALLAPEGNAARTVAMLGSSGAGKSTLANLLHGSDIQATAPVSLAVGKGRHTTTTRELIRMPGGGLLLDNPGIREIALHEDGSGVSRSFADIETLAETCRFADCTHESEPGCCVLRAAERGELAPERLESWRKLHREMQYARERSEKSADRVEKDRWKEIAQLQKRFKSAKR